MSDKLKIAIVLDDWKLPIFKETLDNEGYEYSEAKGPTPGCITISIETNNVNKLAPIIKKMNKKARKFKKLH